MNEMSNPQADHLIRESEKLNRELEKLLEETRSREKYSLAIIAGIATWSFTHLNGLDNYLLVIVNCIPILTTLILGLSVEYLYDNILWIGEYLKKIEDYFLKSSIEKSELPMGWEKFLNSKNIKKGFVRTTRIFWYAQIAMAFILFLLAIFYKVTHLKGL